jgi:predicted nucleic acid-binding protein
MSGSKVVLDTNVIIFVSKQMIDIEKFLTVYDEFYVSIVTFIEVFGYEFSNQEEQNLIDRLFKIINIVDVDSTIAELAVTIRKNKNKKIKLPDAIILATAKFLKSPLLTDDWDDFQNIDKDVLIKNIDFFKI